jgi:hypothetical protein
VLALGVHGVAGHGHARQIGEGPRQRLEGGDLVGFLASVELGQDQAREVIAGGEQMNLGARGPGRSAQGLAVGRHCVQPASAPARRSASQRPTARSSSSPSMRPGSRRTVASAGRHCFGNSGSGRTPGRSRTDGGASVIHSPTASREAAPARTAHAVSASMTTRACRTPRDREGRAPRPGAPAAPGCSRSWSKASGIGDDASAGTVHSPADIFRLASITSMSVAPCGNCLPWLPPGTTPTAAAVRTWAAPWSSTTAGSPAPCAVSTASPGHAYRSASCSAVPGDKLA